MNKNIKNKKLRRGLLDLIIPSAIFLFIGLCLFAWYDEDEIVTEGSPLFQKVVKNAINGLESGKKKTIVDNNGNSPPPVGHYYCKNCNKFHPLKQRKAHKKSAIVNKTVSIAASTKQATFEWLNANIGKIKSIFGKPPQVLGKKETILMYNYYDQGIVFYFFKERVLYWRLQNKSKFTTKKGLSIGSSINVIIKVYGKWTKEERRDKWFSGHQSNILYYYPKYNRYKLIYPNDQVIFILNKNKNVELIYLGNIKSLLIK